MSSRALAGRIEEVEAAVPYVLAAFQMVCISAVGMHYTPRIMKLPETIAVVGVGLLGGSIAAAIRKRSPNSHVVGIGRNQSRLSQAVALGLLNSADTAISGVACADMIVVCTPVNRIVADIRAAAEVARPEAVITDVGSVKGAIVSEVTELILDGRFVGSHPMAGSEKTGFENADPDLFEGANCIICPTEKTPAETTARVSSFWTAVGANVRGLDADRHDQIVAAISHVPHAVAAALARSPDRHALEFAATGFTDTTRVAAGDADLWTAILMSNREAVLKSLSDFEAQIAELRSAIEAIGAIDAGEAGETHLRQYLSEAASLRQRL